jgi:hypothetical protein
MLRYGRDSCCDNEDSMRTMWGMHVQKDSCDAEGLSHDVKAHACEGLNTCEGLMRCKLCAIIETQCGVRGLMHDNGRSSLRCKINAAAM